MSISVPKPKRKTHWIEYLLIIAFIGVVAVAVGIQLRKNVASVYGPIDPCLKVAITDGVTLDLPVIGQVPDANGNARMFSVFRVYLGSDDKSYEKIPQGETSAIDRDGEPVCVLENNGISYIKCFKLNDPRVHLGKDGRYHLVELP
jgi:Flp pilus assembly pilin Flp